VTVSVGVRVLRGTLWRRTVSLITTFNDDSRL
jgi:hypothetical protein